MYNYGYGLRKVRPTMSTIKTTKWVEITQKIGVQSPGQKIIYDDGIPMETDWHRAAMNLLIEIIAYFWRHRKDFYVGGNMFIYFDPDQVKKRNFRGPDFFLVKGVTDSERWRDAWILWEEDGLAPHLVIELTSSSTETEDKGPKKEIYERILRVPEYFCYHPQTQELVGWRLQGGDYVKIEPSERDWLWSEELELWVGTWWGKYLGRPNRWLRFFDIEENLVLTEAESQAEARRAAEAEIAQLKAELKQLGQNED
jgi:Uma2 family endonuclease